MALARAGRPRRRAGRRDRCRRPPIRCGAARPRRARVGRAVRTDASIRPGARRDRVRARAAVLSRKYANISDVSHLTPLARYSLNLRELAEPGSADVARAVWRVQRRRPSTHHLARHAKVDFKSRRSITDNAPSP
ncbi:hypothetical protein BCEP4_540032 [Burkholderia cepacia]|nr:hypothetical protein BCEP4_540032 [Burkholderia cepacia]